MHAIKIAMCGLAAAGSYLVLTHDSQHYMMVDALLAEGLDHWADKDIKVHGFVEGASISQTIVDHQMVRSFVLAKNGGRLRVFTKGPVPDTFRDDAEVVAVGHLVAAGDMAGLAGALKIRADSEHSYVLDTNELMAKCPDHYDRAPTQNLAGSGR
jgi:cytochrome c-type biogenesis protein CcmE